MAVDLSRCRSTPRALDYTESILPGPIPNESELTAGARIEPGSRRLLHRHDACASAARPARSPARSGTAARRRHRADRPQLRQHRRARRRRPGGTSRSSSRSHAARRASGPTTMPPFQSNWLMMSDVCKHCERAGCLEACPTGALCSAPSSTRSSSSRTSATAAATASRPARSASSSSNLDDGKAHKCTLCYDRLKGGLEPACAKACPTELDPVRRAWASCRRAPGGA